MTTKRDPYEHSSFFAPGPIILQFLLLASLVCCCAQGTLAWGQASVQGEPFTCNGVSGCGQTFGGPTGLYLDAFQFAGTDMCARINAALTFASGGTIVPKTVYTIDARGFTGVQACGSNPFTGSPGMNLAVRLLLGNVFIVASTPWFTPQRPHAIIGIVPGEPDSSPFDGTVIAACGPGLNGFSGITYNSPPVGPHTCTFGTSTVQQFPQANPLTFNTTHGPFPPSSSLPSGSNYACIICGGGQGLTEGTGWEMFDGGEEIRNIRIDLGGKPGHGDVENKQRFPHLHTPDDDYGQRSKEPLH